MSTSTLTRVAPRSSFDRVWAVTKLHFANPNQILVMPWFILGIIFLANVLIWWIIDAAIKASGETDQPTFATGAIAYVFVYMIVVAAMAMTATFQFALGYGVTRRDYYLGSALAFVILSAIFSVGITILAEIEKATGGWWLGGDMFVGAIVFGNGGWLQHLFITFVALLFFFFVGAAVAGVYARWRATGMTIFFSALGFLIIGLAALFTFTSTWHLVGEFFGYWGYLGSYAWSLVLTAIAGVTGFYLLRGATPRS